jgi:putative sterol carrier protein
MPKATSAQQIFDHLPEAFLPEEAQGVNGVIQFELTGEGGGEWHARIAGGQVAVAAGRAENPTVTLTASAANYLAIINGDLSPMSAFMGGKLQIQGDLQLAMKMQKMFRRPEP